MARPDLDALMSALMPFAQRMLSKHGEFYPFGAAIDRDGQVRLMAGGADTDRPLANQVIDALVTGFRRAAADGEVRAVGLCFDARTIPPGSDEKVDSIVLELEHVDGDCVLVALPVLQRPVRSNEVRRIVCRFVKAAGLQSRGRGLIQCGGGGHPLRAVAERPGVSRDASSRDVVRALHEERRRPRSRSEPRRRRLQSPSMLPDRLFARLNDRNYTVVTVTTKTRIVRIGSSRGIRDGAVALLDEHRRAGSFPT